MSIAEKLTQIAENVPKVYNAGVANWFDDYEISTYGYEYRYAGYGWYDKTFKPRTDMKPSSCMGMFYMFDYSNQGTNHDLVDMLEKAGITLSFENAASMHSVFAASNLSHLGVLNAVKASSWYQTFYNSKVETIDEMVCNENQTFSNTFFGANKLKNLKVAGVIGNNISFSDSPLTLESAMSVIACLINNIAITKTLTITFSPSTKALLDAAGAIFGDGYTWDVYLTGYMGWNC